MTANTSLKNLTVGASIREAQGKLVGSVVSFDLDDGHIMAQVTRGPGHSRKDDDHTGIPALIKIRIIEVIRGEWSLV